jgi:hypothetical protein
LATWQLIEYTSRTIVRLIEARLDAVLGSPPGTHSVDVKLATPHSFSALKTASKATVSVFLYRITEHTELRNSPPRRLPDGSTRRQPLVLELSFLITTWGARGTDAAANDTAATLEEHKLLGIVMQGLYDHAELSRAELYEDHTQPAVWGERDGLQIVLETLPIEDLYRIWDSSELAYQLSATYRVRVLGLDATDVRHTAPVVDADFQIGRTA